MGLLHDEVLIKTNIVQTFNLLPSYKMLKNKFFFIFGEPPHFHFLDKIADSEHMFWNQGTLARQDLGTNIYNLEAQMENPSRS